MQWFGPHVSMKVEICDKVRAMTDEDLVNATKGMKRPGISRVLLAQGNLLYVPPATLILERSVNNVVNYVARVT